jgi:ribonuclease HII
MGRILFCKGLGGTMNHMIVGIDEVGRGAWAGPLVVGAVFLGGANIPGLTDSKKLTKKQRELLDVKIRQTALAIGIGWVSARQLDRIGLSEALKLASRRALSHIRHEYQEIIIDGTIRLIDHPKVTLMKKADLLVPSVSAASIVAKVARDNYMKHIDAIFPGYNFSRHVGYGTALHRQAIADLGVTHLHRTSFMPLHSYKTLQPTEKVMTSGRTTKQIGDAGENEAVRHLREGGHTILARNWRTRFCEIDIVSRLGETVYFTEVKYRKSDRHGNGVAAITPKKQRQMTFAAEYFAVKEKIKNTNLRLAVADVTGTPPLLRTFLELG